MGYVHCIHKCIYVRSTTCKRQEENAKTADTIVTAMHQTVENVLMMYVRNVIVNQIQMRDHGTII